MLPQITLINGYGSSETGNMGFGHSRRGTQPTPSRSARADWSFPRTTAGSFRPASPRSAGWPGKGESRLGYFNDPDATRKTFPEVDGKRVVISGDRASLEADGTMRLYGRDSLVVNTGGEKVFVEEVEEVLRAHPAVADALVVGRPSERWGEELVALVELRDGSRCVSPELLHAHCTSQLARFKAPKEFDRRRAGPSPGQRQGRLPVGEKSSDRKGADVDMNTSRIDCLVNVHFGETEKQPTWMLKVRDDYFKGPESMFAPVDLSELLDEMDEQGVARPILMDNLAKPSVTARKFVEAKPDRFALAMGGVNLLRPMPSLRELTAVVSDLPVAYAVVGPSFWGDGQYPPSDAVYYPLYTKCAELELPLCINTGLPGPPIPGEVQNPIHLDRVCVRFPELKLCMIHGADPWWDIAIRLLIKYENLRLMTSAWSPKRLPESLLHYMRTRGPNKVIFASDWPVLKMRRVVPEAHALDLPADVLRELPLQQRARILLSGPEGALTMDRYELRRLDYSLTDGSRGTAGRVPGFLQDPLSDRNGAGRGGIRVRQEPVGAVVRDGRDDDGAAGIRWGRRCDAGRPDLGGRGDRALAGAGAVDRPRLRGPAARPARLGRIRRRERQAARGVRPAA